MRGSKSAIPSLFIDTLFYFLLTSCLCKLTSCRTNTLYQNQTIQGNQFLVSANYKFVLEIFAPGNSENLYLGIRNFRFQARAVWVANRENPITDSNVKFTIQSNGNLAVIDRFGDIFWSTNATVPSNTTVAVLQDSGNLILREGNASDSGKIMWQSFDHPTDALLPGMKLGINLTTNQTKMLRSWKNDDDPAPGNFAFGIDSDGLNQFFIYRRSIPYRRALFWNGSAYDVAAPYRGQIDIDITRNEDEVYFSLDPKSNITFLVMRPEGVLAQAKSVRGDLRILYLDFGAWIGEEDKCSISGSCGQYSSCNVNRRPVCKCLPGFEPNSNDPAEGCKRKSSRDCGKDQGVLVLNGVEVLTKAENVSTSADEEECKAAFLSGGCNNKAYDFLSNVNQCRIWDDLLDIREEQNANEDQLTQAIRISVAASDLKQHRRQCDNCGSNVIPYPLSTDLSCGDPKYGAFFCNISSGQLYFRTLSGSYAIISSISADTRTFVIKLEGVDLCWARSEKRNDIHLNSSQPFRLTNKTTVFLFNCSTSQNIKLNCTDSSACHKYMREGGAPCYNLEKCCTYVVEDSSYIGVSRTGCNAYSSIVNLNSSLRITEWWEGVEIMWKEDEIILGASLGKKIWVLVTISLAIAVVVLLILATTAYHYQRKIIKKKMIEEEERKDIDLPFFDLQTIVAATEKFSDSNKLGQGGFGPVYKLPGGLVVAIKRLCRNFGQGEEEFKNEVMLIAKLQHRNLVRLLGCCIQGDERILLYEYMLNKSLDYFLFDSNRSKQLNWENRYEIILGIARGLLYLHEDSRLRIIHRDLKTSNILLDEAMKPKISDFGMARIFGGNQTQENTNRVVGTCGYMSPEYAFHGLFSMKSDVFSFGVILLEIICGKKNAHFYHDEEPLGLLGHAWRLWKEEKWMDLIDANLSKDCNLSEVQKCIQISLLCVEEKAEDRPTMAAVVHMLNSETTTLPTPKQVSFVTRSLSYQTPSSFSKNEITVSTLEGR